jgi:ribosomal protein L44E
VVGKNVSNMQIIVSKEDKEYINECLKTGVVLKEDLRRWFIEKWVDVSRKVDGKHPPCGRKDADGKAYPKCRPSKKVSNDTPKVASSYDKKEKKAMTSQKRRAEKNDPKVGKGNKPTMTKFDESTKNDKKIVCDGCNWSWKLSEGGNDPYMCHKCGNDNTKKYKKMIITVTEEQFERLFEYNEETPVLIYEDEDGSVQMTNYSINNMLNEAEYQGRKVQLGKIMQGDIKKFKVYVKNDKGKVVKVNFGFGGKSAKGKRMVIKKNNPERRKSFRARHNCENPGPRWKPRYWACKTW